MKEHLKVSDEQFQLLVNNLKLDYDKDLKTQNAKHKNHKLFKKILYSGLGAVRVDKMRPHDTLPATDAQGRGVRMVGATDNNIRVYVYLPSTGDGFCLLVPFDLPVGGAPRSLRGLIAQTIDLPVDQVKLFFNSQPVISDHASINMYNICHSSTVTVLPRTKKSDHSISDLPFLATAAGAADRTGTVLRHRARLFASHSDTLTVLPKWTHEHHPNLFREDGLLGRKAGTLGSQDVAVFDYANNVAMIKDMGHQDVVGDIRKSLINNSLYIFLSFLHNFAWECLLGTVLIVLKVSPI